MEEKCTSLMKIEANRRNAQKSTGPQDTSLTRLNALKHGILNITGYNNGAKDNLDFTLKLTLSPGSKP